MAALTRARNMVARFGMHEKLGLVTYETPRQTFLGENALAHFAEREFSEETAREIDCAVREVTTAAFEKASALLRKYRWQLDEGARLLLEKETLTREELRLIEIPLPAIAAATSSTV
jgi:cell division protease FtsH